MLLVQMIEKTIMIMIRLSKVNHKLIKLMICKTKMKKLQTKLPKKLCMRYKLFKIFK